MLGKGRNCRVYKMKKYPKEERTISINEETFIMDDIMNRIVSNSFEAGEKLPSENKLAEAFSVPRMTVRNALVKLEERGYIYSEQGVGRFVNNNSTQIQLHLTGKTSFTDKMKQLGYHIKTKTISCEKVDYEEKLFHQMDAKQGDAIYRISRIRLIDNEPIAIHNSFVNEALFPNISEQGSQIESMFAYYREQGYHTFSSTKTLLSITFPTSYEQELLCCKSMVPLLVVETDTTDVASQQVLEHTKILYRSDRFKYDITIDD